MPSTPEKAAAAMAEQRFDLYRFGVFIRLFERQIYAGEDDEPSRFVQEWEGHIAYEPPGEDAHEEVIGSFCFHFIDLGAALNQRVSYFDVFDTYQSTFDVFQTLYDLDTNELKQDVAKVAFGRDYQLSEGVLILERLEVLPAHRGHLVGLRAMKAIIEQFRAGSGLVVLKAFPLQFEGDGPTLVNGSSLPREQLRLDNFTRSERVARSKLKKYYGRLGFKPAPHTEYMILDPIKNLPSLEQLARTRVPKTHRPKIRKLSLVRESR